MPNHFIKQPHSQHLEMLGHTMATLPGPLQYTRSLKFYHSGQVYGISSQKGTQQGDPLGTILFAAPLHPILLQVAFADNFIFLGPSTHAISAIDTYNHLLSTVNLKLNPHESYFHPKHPNPTKLATNHHYPSRTHHSLHYRRPQALRFTNRHTCFRF